MLRLALLVTAAALAADATAAERVRPIDTARSYFTIHVYRSGFFAFAGDNHEIRAPIASGAVEMSPLEANLAVRSRSLVVLDPQLRPNKRAQVQEKMLGPDVLDAARYPSITFRSRAIGEGPGGRLEVHGELTIHGQTRDVALTGQRVGGSEFRGGTTLRQTDYGIKPITIAGGAVKVKDEIKIDFDVFVR